RDGSPARREPARPARRGRGAATSRTALDASSLLLRDQGTAPLGSRPGGSSCVSRAARVKADGLQIRGGVPPVPAGTSGRLLPLALGLLHHLLERLAALLLTAELVGELLDLGLHLAALVGQAHLQGLDFRALAAALPPAQDGRADGQADQERQQGSEYARPVHGHPLCP